LYTNETTGLLIAADNTTLYVHHYNADLSTFDGNADPLNYVYLNIQGYQAGGLNHHIMSRFTNNQYSIWSATNTGIGGFYNVNGSPVKAYTNQYNDRYPFVDRRDGYRIYFASDRYGKGNYDLYRYNKLTFNLVTP
jgi:hypothetical protein